MRVRVVIAIGLTWLVAGCTEPSSGPSSMPGGHGHNTIQRVVDYAQVSRGGILYAKHCAECHGRLAEGADNWRQRDADGMMPPPPLNGSGHAWHHPHSTLLEVIQGGSPPGMGKMPAWQDRLSDEEIEAVIAWFQSQWPDEAYASWYLTNQRALAAKW